jgi:hypothetical protein
MGFADVHGEEVGAVFVIVVEFGEVAYLAAKRRSGVASKNENERAPADAITKRKSRLPIESDQFDVRRSIADAQIAAVPVRQRVPQEAIDVARPAHQIAQYAVTEHQDYN